MRTSIRSVLVISIVAASALFFSACSSGAPELTPLPTTSDAQRSQGIAAPTEVPTEPPLTVPAPADEAAAIEMATLSVQMFLEVEAETFSEHPEDVSAIDTVASGKAAEETKQSVADINAAGSRAGYFTFESVGDLTKVSEDDDNTVTHGYVEFYGCLIPHDIAITNDSGTVNELTHQVSTYFLVKYEKDKGGWYVRDYVSYPEGGPSC